MVGADGFGMLAENLMRGKSTDASQFAEYVLVDELCGLNYSSADVDLNEDGIVDWPDLAILTTNWLWPE